MLQHYRSGLNAIPSMDQYMRDPTDLYLLRLAAGSLGGVLTNIDVETGAPGMAFHSDQSLLHFDAALQRIQQLAVCLRGFHFGSAADSSQLSLNLVKHDRQQLLGVLLPEAFEGRRCFPHGFQEGKRGDY